MCESPETEACLKQVVSNYKHLQFKRFSLLHQSWSKDLDDEDVKYANENSWPDGGHQREVVRSGVSEVFHHIRILVIQPEIKFNLLQSIIQNYTNLNDQIVLPQ